MKFDEFSWNLLGINILNLVFKIQTGFCSVNLFSRHDASNEKAFDFHFTLFSATNYTVYAVITYITLHQLFKQ